ncbi:hypothetical protein [Acidisphaera sp. S103]|uniref:hypothetical protein n=1 Tax=Acidisphaera sp. S103 TaxID=1747223 RepID=UPI00131AFCB8|nr:hypothetical protein [Acidisphaera sp. S103]
MAFSVGEGGSGKSLIALQATVSIETRQLFLDRKMMQGRWHACAVKTAPPSPTPILGVLGLQMQELVGCVVVVADG